MSTTALLLHAAMLGGAGWVWPSTEAAPLPSAVQASMQVRVVDAPPVVATVDAVPSPLPPTAQPNPPRAEPARPRALAAAPAVPAMPVAARAAAPVVALVVEDPATTAVTPIALVDVVDVAEAPTVPNIATAPSAAASTAVAPAIDEPIPHYRTRIPPAVMLRYDVSRGVLRGIGELVWRPQPDRYELKLDFKLSGLTILSQVSSGAFDAAGIAPVRFTDQRFRRGTTAANFQRAADKITYSGSPNEFALKPGAQDRLSWMLQLAAIVAAEPRLAKAGAKVAMSVTGSHGDVDVWVFRCVGPESIDSRGGQVATIKFVREPREAYDTTVQVWLDPKLNDLPVRATQKSANDDGYELHLLEVVSSN